ncbi:MAG: outer membrane beta-barrel protein [Siphonobacter sp.]
MKKNVLLGVLLLLSFFTNAQYSLVNETRTGYVRYQNYSNIRMSFRFSPFVSGNRVEGVNTFSSFDSNGSGMRLSLGPVADFFFADKYAFSTGLWYTVKSVQLRNGSSFLANITPSSTATSSTYNLQFLQVPISFKLHTNDVSDRVRLYMQFGLIGNIKLSEKPINRSINALYLYKESQNYSRVFDVGGFDLLLGTGAEYGLTGGDALTFGLSYQRGLTNIYRNNDLSIKTNCFFLDLGYKF